MIHQLILPSSCLDNPPGSLYLPSDNLEYGFKLADIFEFCNPNSTREDHSWQKSFRPYITQKCLMYNMWKTTTYSGMYCKLLFILWITIKIMFWYILIKGKNPKILQAISAKKWHWKCSIPLQHHSVLIRISDHLEIAHSFLFFHLYFSKNYTYCNRQYEGDVCGPWGNGGHLAGCGS